MFFVKPESKPTGDAYQVHNTREANMETYPYVHISKGDYMVYI